MKIANVDLVHEMKKFSQVDLEIMYVSGSSVKAYSRHNNHEVEAFAYWDDDDEEFGVEYISNGRHIKKCHAEFVAHFRIEDGFELKIGY